MDAMKPLILYRKYEYDYEDGELEGFQRVFPSTTQRCSIKTPSLVIGRNSVLPHYQELEDDLGVSGSKLINSYRQHCYVANLGNYYSDLVGLTPKSWPDFSIDEPGPYVLKGETNSRRQRWLTHMFAADRDAAHQVYLRLSEDPLLSGQSIWIRKYEPLANFGLQVNGLPIGNEYRFFILDGQILTGGFYWNSCLEDMSEKPDISRVPMRLIQAAIDKIGNSCRFYTMDIAEKADGNWTIIELNDGQMSGLSCNSPKDLYENMKIVLGGGKSRWLS